MVAFKGQFNDQVDQIEGTLYLGKHSVPLRFTRLLERDPNCAFLGDWEELTPVSGRTELKIRRSSMNNLYAVMDGYGAQGSSFGSLFDGWLPTDDELRLDMVNTGLEPHTLHGSLDGQSALSSNGTAADF